MRRPPNCTIGSGQLEWWAIRHMAASTTAPKSELASAGDPPERSWRSFVLPAITLLLFLAATWAIHRELAAWTFADITAAVEAIPVDRLALAVLAGALSYAVLALYDPLALAPHRQAAAVAAGCPGRLHRLRLQPRHGSAAAERRCRSLPPLHRLGPGCRRNRRDRRIQQPDLVAWRRRDAVSRRSRGASAGRRAAPSGSPAPPWLSRRGSARCWPAMSRPAGSFVGR